MKVTPIDHGLDYYGKSSGPRSHERLHMSQIYGSLFQEMYPDRFVKDRPMNPGHLELGLAWENMLEDGIKERLRAGQGADRPGEFVTEEGIVFSPDLLLFNGVTRLGEIKLTWVSSKAMPRTAGESFPSHPTVQKWLCVAPTTQILTSDLRYISAGSVKVGDRLLGFDEHVLPHRNKRRMRHTTVTRVKTLRKPAVRLTLRDGTSIVCSTDHQWFAAISESQGPEWTRTDMLMQTDRAAAWGQPRKSNSFLTRILPPQLLSGLSAYDTGWIAGVFDGEGSLSIDPTGKASMGLSAAQRPGPVFDRMKQVLEDGGYPFSEYAGVGGYSGKPVHSVNLWQKDQQLRFLGSTRPTRLLDKFVHATELMALTYDKVEVVSREDLGTQTVVAIETDTHTYIAEGLASHNCQMMAYAYHLDTPYARLYAFHVNGEYAWMRKGGDKNAPGGPQLFAYDIEFSKRELHDNWQMLLGHAKSSGLLKQYGL